MRFILIETCTERGVISFVDENKIIFEKELPFGITQSKYLSPYLEEMFKSIGSPPSLLDAIGVGVGPGSYTGIRVGAAFAQALAYAWKVPLIGFSSLNGFIPIETDVHFAAILDARIGGVYLRKGWRDPAGMVHYTCEPKICSLEEIGKDLDGVTHFITPSAKTLSPKMKLHFPNSEWEWVERGPSVQALASSVIQLNAEGKITQPPEHLHFLYLRETEAERNKEK